MIPHKSEAVSTDCFSTGVQRYPEKKKGCVGLVFFLPQFSTHIVFDCVNQ